MPQWQVLVLRRARNYLERLPAEDRRRILDALDKLANDPPSAPVKKLKGRPEWSLHVGTRRVLFLPDKRARLIVVTDIGPRGDVYK